MSTYTMSDVKEADRLYDQMPMRDVAEKIGISEKTLSGWKEKGLIDTEVNHRTKYSAQQISRASELWDSMPLPKVSEMMDIPVRTLENWSRKGWINTDQDRQGGGDNRSKEYSPEPVIEMYFQSDKSMEEVAGYYGISPSTVSKYVRQYRNGDL
ncbi:MerR family transcriptional regulator [Salinibacter ruber]|jgi:transposase-like protein|uniref:MerR family transcriptional regulator n=1 Tax=Salinibacter ruber TaxID=146919 RepID=UPI0021686DCC|nr:MerR family transcriptional regulator [Salinibacter ruber]